MKLTDDLGDLSTRGTAALLGAMALCCLVPMLVIFGAVSVAGALFGGTALVIVGAVAVVGWVAWSARHHAHGGQHERGGAQDRPDSGSEQSNRTR